MRGAGRQARRPAAAAACAVVLRDRSRLRRQQYSGPWGRAVSILMAWLHPDPFIACDFAAHFAASRAVRCAGPTANDCIATIEAGTAACCVSACLRVCVGQQDGAFPCARAGAGWVRRGRRRGCTSTSARHSVHPQVHHQQAPAAADPAALAPARQTGPAPDSSMAPAATAAWPSGGRLQAPDARYPAPP